MKIVAVMQPSFLPWAGYFHLIARSDCFVFLNDAQFQKKFMAQPQPHFG